MRGITHVTGVWLTAVTSLLTYVHGQTTWTFNHTGNSYMEFEPDLVGGQDQRYTFAFKTKQRQGLLLRHYIDSLKVN